jgi:hypothetical protein
MPWSWIWFGFLAGLAVGGIMQGPESQRALWSMLPAGARLLWLRIAGALALYQWDATWQQFLLWGVCGAVCALLLNFLIRGVEL